MKIKELEFNNKKITIDFSSFTEGEFNFFALDDKKNMVAKCSFDLMGLYVCKPTTLKNSSVQFEKAVGIICDDKMTIKKEEQIFRNKSLYSLQGTYCKLRNIEICDRKFYKIGLGTELFKCMEGFSIKQNCTKISAWVFPHGEFGMGTLKFYKRNGFAFTIDQNDHTIATKELNTNIKQNNQTLCK